MLGPVPFRSCVTAKCLPNVKCRTGQHEIEISQNRELRGFRVLRRRGPSGVFPWRQGGCESRSLSAKNGFERKLTGAGSLPSNKAPRRLRDIIYNAQAIFRYT